MNTLIKIRETIIVLKSIHNVKEKCALFDELKKEHGKAIKIATEEMLAGDMSECLAALDLGITAKYALSAYPKTYAIITSPADGAIGR
jgi:hypothetical protein